MRVHVRDGRERATISPLSHHDVRPLIRTRPIVTRRGRRPSNLWSVFLSARPPVCLSVSLSACLSDCHARPHARLIWSSCRDTTGPRRRHRCHPGRISGFLAWGEVEPSRCVRAFDWNQCLL